MSKSITSQHQRLNENKFKNNFNRYIRILPNRIVPLNFELDMKEQTQSISLNNRRPDVTGHFS